MIARLASPLLRVHPSVASALASRKPVVALESTIITHGLPFPDNIETALAIEQAVRDQGAVPATTAFLDGKAYVGLEQDQLQRLAESGLKATKTSRRDVASVLTAGKGSTGATTVSGTMILAHMAGISIFGTGGIGGVHRGGQHTMDVSADLTESSRTPVAVFCSGAKSILDIPRTLEYLETFGVSTHTFDPSGQFPAFYSAHSGCKVPIVSTHKEAAQLIHSNMLFNMQSGMIFGVPIPEDFEAAGGKIQLIVEQAVQEAKEAGIDRRGKEVTPWLLKRVGELSQGQSITSNKALVINNVTTAAKVARELEVLRQDEENAVDSKSYFVKWPDLTPEESTASVGISTGDLTFVGSTAVDITSQPNAKHEKQLATTWPGCNALSLGGVARNMAESAHRILSGVGSVAGSVKLISPIGDDILGRYVRSNLTKVGLRTDGLIETTRATSSVTLQLDHAGDLVTGIADIDATDLSPALRIASSHDDSPRVIAFDANMSSKTMTTLLQIPRGITIFEPTSVVKCIKILGISALPDIMTPNEAELTAMYTFAVRKGLLCRRHFSLTDYDSDFLLAMNANPAVIEAAKAICEWRDVVLLIKLGDRGVLLARSTQKGAIFNLYPASKIPKDRIINTTGCGDTFAGAAAACIHAKLSSGDANRQGGPLTWPDINWKAIIKIAQEAAVLTLQSSKATSTELNKLSAQVESFARSST